MLVNNRWKIYNPTKRLGKLCTQYCSKQSALPLRDLLNDHHHGYKTEPNYETATYNLYSTCHQPSIQAAVRDGVSHLLFITKYTGTKKRFHGRYFIVGYYKLGWRTTAGGNTAVRASTMHFVPIESAYEITDSRWQRINRYGDTSSLENMRWASQRLQDPLLAEILSYLDTWNATSDYLREVALLKSKHIPFDEVPEGRIFIINVGANTSSPLQSPLFDDGRFELTPIPEHETLDPTYATTFADLRQFYNPSEPLRNLFSASPISPSTQFHHDPEFLTFTYGDNFDSKSNLKDLRKGDYLFFLARLVPYTNSGFQHKKAIFALVGYLEMDEVVLDPHPALFTSPAFRRNAHVLRWLNDLSSFTHFAIIKGSTNSRRFHYAVPFTRKFVETVPLLMADGSRWDWGRTSELGIIGSNTRATRMYIDPSKESDIERAIRFWEYIWNKQGQT